MTNYARRLTLLRRPTQVADPAQMVDLRMGEVPWRRGFFGALCASSTAETRAVPIWVCTEEGYKEATEGSSAA